jgi:Threonine dehydrogenase and related Zn-dependent dehydrogenases
MKAVCWYGTNDVRVSEVDEPKIINRRDAILKITRTAICGSDLHLYDGYIPTMEKGDILGHEFMGEVVALGHENGLKIGDRVVVPFAIACGNCWFCKQRLTSLCDNSNPNAGMADELYGTSGSGLFGYSHLFGGYAGGQAQYVRVPYSDVGPLKIPDSVTDEQALFLSDIFPTGYMAAENCNIQGGDTVAVWGCGPVGQFAIRSAYLLGAGRVIALDRFPERLAMAAEGGAETLNYEDIDVIETLKEMTGGRGPDSCIDAVGMEAHGTTPALYDRAKTAMMMATDRPQPPETGDPGLPERRHRLHSRRVRRLSGQNAHGRRVCQRPHIQDGTNPCAPLHETSIGSSGPGRHRSFIRHYASSKPEGCGGRLRDFQKQTK